MGWLPDGRRSEVFYGSRTPVDSFQIWIFFIFILKEEKIENWISNELKQKNMQIDGITFYSQPPTAKKTSISNNSLESSRKSFKLCDYSLHLLLVLMYWME